MKFGGSLARNIDLDVANFRLLVKTFVSYNLSKLEEVSHQMQILKLQPVSFGVSAFTVSLGEAAKPFVFQCVKVSKLKEVSHEGNLARNVRFEAPTCLVSICAFAVSMGEAAKPVRYTPHSTLHILHSTLHSDLHSGSLVCLVVYKYSLENLNDYKFTISSTLLSKNQVCFPLQMHS